MSLDPANEIISEIYEAAAVPEYWPTVLGKMSARVDGAGGIMFTSVLDRIRWTASPDIHDVFDEFIRDGWAAINPRPARIAALNPPEGRRARPPNSVQALIIPDAPRQ